VATQGSGTGRLVDLVVDDFEASATGLSCGGTARCLVVPATELPTELWSHLLGREPVCLVSRLDGERVTGTELFTAGEVDTAGDTAADLFGRQVSDATLAGEQAVTVLWPVPTLVVVGAGAIGEALQDAARLLGWRVLTADDAATGTGLVAGLAALDKLVVLSHDLDVAGPVLAAALDTGVGYIGAVGSRRTQQARADWLAYRGIGGLDRIHGPAGLDIGATTPAEIAVSILAEALAAAGAPTRP
jgi:xanthine dehydrogenase accessory factor